MCRIAHRFNGGLYIMILFLFSQPAEASMFSMNELPPKMPQVFKTSDQVVMLGSNLMAVNSGTTADLADGNRVVFDDKYSNEFDAYDAIKLTNVGENFGLLRNNKILAVEARSSIKSNDTLYYNMSGLRAMEYQLMFLPINMNTVEVKAELIDNYLNSRSPVNLMETSYLPFTVNSDAASNATDRFMLVFSAKAAGPLPVTFSSVSANRNRYDKIDISWKTENEVNIKHYELERSSNGRVFEKIHTRAAATNNGSGASYSYLDESLLQGVNFFRVKAVSENGLIQYSSIVKVSDNKAAPSISVYPNPVMSGSAQVSFTNKPAGNYQIQLINNNGQVVYNNKWNIQAGNSIRKIENSPQSKQLAVPGVYHLRIISEAGESEVMSVMVAK